MSKLDEKIALYSKEMTKLGIKVESDLLRAVTKGCGPSIYNNDAETVSGSDPAELDRVKKNFMEKKLGLSGKDLDAGMPMLLKNWARAIETNIGLFFTI